MFVVTGVWAFPLFVLPIFKRTIVLTLPEWLYSAIHQPGAPRIWAESVLIFSLMVVALLLRWIHLSLYEISPAELICTELPRKEEVTVVERCGS
jgi:ABC-type spermidine/putrescine transport system permease subunit II